MPGPPTDVTPQELFLRLQEKRPSEVVAFPRKTADGKPVGKLRIQVLPGRVHDTTRLAAIDKAKNKYKLSKDDQESELGRALISDCVAKELLALACCTEENFGDEEKPFYPLVFPSPEAIGDVLSQDEIAVLFNCYLLVQNKWGPFDKTIGTEEELSDWIKRLVEGAAEFPLQQLASVHWAEAASLLAVRAYTLSAILESLFSSLPSTLASRLGTYSLGTNFFGKPAPNTSATGSETFLNLRVLDVDITTDDARDMAMRMKDAEEGALAALDAIERERAGA